MNVLVPYSTDAPNSSTLNESIMKSMLQHMFGTLYEIVPSPEAKKQLDAMPSLDTLIGTGYSEDSVWKAMWLLFQLHRVDDRVRWRQSEVLHYSLQIIKCCNLLHTNLTTICVFVPFVFL